LTSTQRDLLRHARAARKYVLLTAALGGLTAGLVITQALLLSGALAPVIDGAAAWDDVAGTVGLIALVVLARVVVTGAQERFAHRAAGRVIAELRERVLSHAVALGPRWLAEAQPAGVATLTGRGLDGLEPYFVRYLPQLLLAATVTPAALVVVAGLDWIAGLTIAITIPLVPIFMVLIGRLTAGHADRRLAVMRRLGHQVLDLLAGLPTLRALGREQGPARRVRELGDAHRRATMGTLRIAFLSGMVLELLTTLSVALVAVGVGLRLVYGGLDLRTGLAVLILAPEVYLPLRAVGAHFHASADGVAAADRAFAVLAEPLPAPGTAPAPDLRRTTIVLTGVSVLTPDRAGYAPSGLDLRLEPGSFVALTGPNGSGKSTAAAVILGLIRPGAGTVRLVGPAGDVDLHDIDLRGWWPQIAWVPQRPTIEAGSVREAVGAASPAELEEAAGLTGLADVVAGLPGGWDCAIGHGGHGLSLGERQRLALTRALLGAAPLVILDEPTAHLDSQSRRHVDRVIRALRDSGRTVLLVSHEPSDADTVVACRSAEAPSGSR
jgi:ATP-binding cassette subfamily C protein CydD